jgi:hypothetical protein
MTCLYTLDTIVKLRCSRLQLPRYNERSPFTDLSIFQGADVEQEGYEEILLDSSRIKRPVISVHHRVIP